MENTILYSSAGATELLVAVPQPKQDLLGSYTWSIPETAGMKVTSRGTLPNPNPTPTFDTIHLYSVELTTQAAVQPFTMVQGSVHPPRALAFGKVSMISHPISQTVQVSCSLPAQGELKIPLMIAVVDRSASTGYHWESHGTGQGLKVAAHTYPSASGMAGAPATQVFFINVTEPGTCHVQIQQFAPNSKQPVSSFVVAYTAF